MFDHIIIIAFDVIVLKKLLQLGVPGWFGMGMVIFYRFSFTWLAFNILDSRLQAKALFAKHFVKWLFLKKNLVRWRMSRPNFLLQVNL